MKHTDKFIIKRVQSQVSKQLIGGLALVVMGLMVFNTMHFVQAANNGTSDLSLTVAGGSLELVNVGSTVTFAEATAGAATNVYQNVNGTTVRDFRDTANFEWDLKMYSQPLTGGTDSNYTIPNTLIKVWPGNATITNIQTFDNTKVGAGSNDTALSTDFIIFNSTYSSTGAVQFDDLGVRVAVNESLSVQEYTGTATLTVVAS